MTRKPHLRSRNPAPPRGRTWRSSALKGQAHEGNGSPGESVVWDLGLKRIGAVRGSGLEPGGGFQGQAWKEPRKCGGEG